MGRPPGNERGIEATRPRGIIFDLDGLIIDSEPLQQDAYIETFRRYGIALGRRDLERWLGHRESEILTGLARQFGITAPADELKQLRSETYARMLGKGIIAMPGAVGAVHAARNFGFRCAVASSSGRLEVGLALQVLGLCEDFEAVVTGDDVSAAKPAPDIYLTTLARLNLDAVQCIAIEDSGVGVLAAAAAGLRVIAVPNSLTRSHDFGAAELVVDSLRSAVDAIARQQCAKETVYDDHSSLNSRC